MTEKQDKFAEELNNKDTIQGDINNSGQVPDETNQKKENAVKKYLKSFTPSNMKKEFLEKEGIDPDSLSSGDKKMMSIGLGCAFVLVFFCFVLMILSRIVS
jgi:hypothetical protein